MEIIAAFVGGGAGALVTGVITLITRYLDKKDTEKRNEKQLQKLEKDSVRTQLLVLMASYPGDKSEILECARHYFEDLHGNWYMTPIFNKWLEKESIGRPEWLQDTKR